MNIKSYWEWLCHKPAPTEGATISNILDDIGIGFTCDMFTESVVIRHQDGSFFDLRNVIVRESRFGQLDVYMVWTEHCGYFYFFKDDLYYFYRRH